MHRRYHNEDFSVGKHIIQSALSEIDGKRVACGILEVFTEALFIPDHSLSNRLKSQALLELMDKAVTEAKRLGISNVYSFVRDPKFSELLKRHFDFKPCTGEPLVLRIENGQEFRS